MAESQPSLVVADLAMARRLERTEAFANAEFVTARAAAFPGIDAQWIEVAGAYAMFDGIDSPCTQTFGLGLFDPFTAAELDKIEEFFRRQGAAPMHEVCPLADPKLLPLLNERGYEPFEYSNVMFRPLDTGTLPKGSDDALAVQLAEAGDQTRWAETAAAGWHDVFPQLDDYIRMIASLYPHRPHSHNFLVESGGEAIAAGGLSIFERVALFAGASTIPQWRHHGAQRALLAHRLQFAFDRGCDLAMIVAAPGSASQRNSERAGFRIAYTRIKWRLRGG